jgi:hypothetical protein
MIYPPLENFSITHGVTAIFGVDPENISSVSRIPLCG